MATEITLDLSPKASLDEPARETHHFKLGEVSAAAIKVGDLFEVVVPADPYDEYAWTPVLDPRTSKLRIRGRRAGESDLNGELYDYWNFEVVEAGDFELEFLRHYFDKRLDQESQKIAFSSAAVGSVEVGL